MYDLFSLRCINSAKSNQILTCDYKLTSSRFYFEIMSDWVVHSTFVGSLVF